MKRKGSLAETASPLRNPAFGVPSSYSHGQNTLHPQVFGEQPNAVPLRSPTYSSLAHTGSRSTLRFTKLSFPGKNALPQTLSNCVCHLAGLSFWGFHKKKQIWKKCKLSKWRKTLKAAAILEHERSSSHVHWALYTLIFLGIKVTTMLQLKWEYKEGRREDLSWDPRYTNPQLLSVATKNVL